MPEIAEGDPTKYIGAFYPLQQNPASPSYNDWQDCAEDLNLVLASHHNYDEGDHQSFVNNVLSYMNNYNTRLALCWDACYAYLPSTTKTCAYDNLYDAMMGVKKGIRAFGAGEYIDCEWVYNGDFGQQLLGGIIKSGPRLSQGVVPVPIGSTKGAMGITQSDFQAAFLWKSAIPMGI